MELLLRNLRLRPSMFFLDGSFGQYVAFLSGFELRSKAAEGDFLEGFGDWISTRFGHDRNVTWPTSVLRSIWPDWNGSAANWSKLDTESENRASAVLFELLAEFKGFKPGASGEVP
ncbi:hypothetical protein [Streptomyces sp. NPDC051577]|uniref:hypothetical protein n=1 Tax=Streptomyces sp. NPDC051577 TaxID=3155166 RepID=UPI00342DF275